MLGRVDPASARRILPRDRKRVGELRGVFLTGKPLTVLLPTVSPLKQYRTLTIAWPADVSMGNASRTCDHRFEPGLLYEIRVLIASVCTQARALSAVFVDRLRSSISTDPKRGEPSRLTRARIDLPRRIVWSARAYLNLASTSGGIQRLCGAVEACSHSRARILFPRHVIVLDSVGIVRSHAANYGARATSATLPSLS